MKNEPTKSASAKEVLKVYGKELSKHPVLLTSVVVGVFGMQAVNVIAPLYLRQFFNILASASPGPQGASQLVYVLGFIGLWWGINWIANRMEHFAGLRIISTVIADVINNSFGYLISHSYNFFISNFSGSLTHKVNKFGKAFQTLYEGFFLTFLPTALFVLGAIVVLFLRSHLLGLVLGLWVLIFVSFQIWVTNLRHPLRKVRAEADTRITATLADAIGNQSTISLFSAHQHERGIFAEVVEVWRHATVRSWNADGYIWAGVGFFMLVIEVGLLYLAIQLWEQGLLTVGDFILIQAYLITMFERLVAIQHELRRMYDALADAGEMVYILTLPHEIKDAQGAVSISVKKGEVQFSNISFSFSGGHEVLRNFNLSIRGGERVALVGPSGAGKSTITKLLLRMYDLPHGAIEIDNQDISRVTQESLRDVISFVPQDTVLFHRSLMDNIRYGKRDATDEEVMEAAKKAHCHEFIVSLAEGYNTYVGERGVKLSGGERQRVAIARAILKNSPILVLDEATSSLDSESEALIQDALATLMQGKTVMVIAHRLSTIMKMDRIVVLDGGKIVAEGTHDELLTQNGLYHKLWSIQAGGFIVDEDGFAEEEKES